MFGGDFLHLSGVGVIFQRSCGGLQCGVYVQALLFEIAAPNAPVEDILPVLLPGSRLGFVERRPWPQPDCSCQVTRSFRYTIDILFNQAYQASLHCLGRSVAEHSPHRPDDVTAMHMSPVGFELCFLQCIPMRGRQDRLSRKHHPRY